MKKNFFKKLSFVLALAMIVSVIAPAAGVFAAAATKLNSTSRVLYLGEDGKNEFDFNVINKVKGSTYAWESSNEKVAVVDEKSGYTTAVGVGSATVSVAIAQKDGKELTLSAKVFVKDNIAEIKTVYLQTQNAAVDKLKVNTEYDFGRTYATKSGASTGTTSVTRWFVNSDKATIDSVGLFKATEAGTYNVTAVAFATSAKYDAWKALNDTTSTLNVLATKTIEVKVVNDATVAQLDSASFKITFAAPVATLTKADVAVDYIVAATSTPIAQVVKEVKLSDDKLSATVTMYNAFSAGSKYVVTITGIEKKDLTAATSNVADVDHFTITPATATVNTATDLTVKVFNKDGVDITTTDLLSRITLTNSSEKVYFNAGAKQVTIYTVGDTTTISGVFHTYSYDSTTGTETGTKTASTVVTGVAAATYAVGNVTDWSIVASAPDFSKANHIIAAGDSGLNLYVKALKTDNKTYLDSSKDAGFTFESADNNTLIINGTTLYPVKAGAVTVLVKFTENGKTTVIGKVDVVVSEARKATTLNLGSYTFALTNSTNVNDTKDVSIEVKDQYGAAVTVKDVAVSKVNEDLASDLVQGGAANVSKTATTVKFVGASAVKGAYTYKVTANGITKYVVVTVNEPTNATVSYYKLNVDKSAYDLKLTSTDTSEIANIKVYGYADNGIATQLAAVSGGAVTVKLFKADGTDVTSLINAPAAATSASITLANVGSPATKVATGVYTVKLYVGSVLKDIVTFEVKDTSSALAVTTAKLSTDALTISAAINDCFTAKLDGNAVTLVAGEIVGTGNVIYVKSVKYTDNLGVTYTADVLTSIKLNKITY